MKSWILTGLRKGVVTTHFPDGDAESVSAWSTRPVRQKEGNVDCPTDAIETDNVNMAKCISCGRCSPQFKPEGDVRIAMPGGSDRTFRRSFHLYLIDTGSCGACNTEVHALSNPVYDLNRLGIFFTNTPRHADALLVVGVLAERMHDVLIAAYDAMPEPRLVIAAGACAISGGIIGRPITDAIQADVLVPGCPPNPFTILDALIKARGGK
jgi:Ni,Fe-hydrogenase III small subunit